MRRRLSLTEEIAIDRAEEAELDTDGAEWDRWLSMSDAEQEAEIDQGMAALVAARAELTVPELYRRDRRSTLKSCLRRRALAKQLHGMDFATKLLRETKVRLLKLREYRRTGVYPGAQ